MRRSLILDVAVRAVLPPVLVLSAFFLFAGHNQPGGGFVGGLVAGAGLALRYVAGGLDDVRSLVRLRAWTVLGAGMLLAVATAALPMVAGAEVLESAKVDVGLGPLGTAHATSALPFDVGVYLVVVGVVLMVLEAFGEAGPAGADGVGP